MTDAPKQYRYKPHTKAIQYTGDNVEILRLFGLNNALIMEIDEYSKSIEIWMDSFNKINIEVGDYIVYGGRIGKDKFERDYEPVPVEQFGHDIDVASKEQAEGGWRPIDEAPIGEDVLLGRVDSNIQRVGYFSHTSDCWISSEKESSIFPTHFQHLPKPPAREGDAS